MLLSLQAIFDCQRASLLRIILEGGAAGPGPPLPGHPCQSEFDWRFAPGGLPFSQISLDIPPAFCYHSQLPHGGGSIQNPKDRGQVLPPQKHGSDLRNYRRAPGPVTPDYRIGLCIVPCCLLFRLWRAFLST